MSSLFIGKLISIVPLVPLCRTSCFRKIPCDYLSGILILLRGSRWEEGDRESAEGDNQELLERRTRHGIIFLKKVL